MSKPAGRGIDRPVSRLRILLDNNVSPKLANDLPGFWVKHVRDLGWTALLNGAPVRAASIDFDVLVTADKNMPFQTPLTKVDLAVAILDCKTNRLADLQPLMPVLIRELPNVRVGEYLWIRSI